jgi:hypothetical protein
VANVEFDICQINKVGINPIVTTFVPNMAQQIDRIFHACPYEVREPTHVQFEWL